MYLCAGPVSSTGVNFISQETSTIFILEMNLPRLAALCLCYGYCSSSSCDRGAALQHQLPGMPWWAFLWQDLRVPSGPGLASHSCVLWGNRSLSRGVTGCVFAARAGTRGLNLVSLHSFLGQHQLWLLGTGHGAGVFAWWVVTPAVSFVSPGFLLNTCWK